MQLLNKLRSFFNQASVEIKECLAEEVRYTIKLRCPACRGMSEIKKKQVDIHSKMKFGRCPTCREKLHRLNIVSWVEPDWVKKEEEDAKRKLSRRN